MAGNTLSRHQSEDTQIDGEIASLKSAEAMTKP
jgi:hypothetical protein